MKRDQFAKVLGDLCEEAKKLEDGEYGFVLSIYSGDEGPVRFSSYSKDVTQGLYLEAHEELESEQKWMQFVGSASPDAQELFDKIRQTEPDFT